MNWLKSIITAFSTAGICFGALFIICPTGKMEKSVKYVLSLCFLLIIITITGVEIKSRDYNISFDNSISVDTNELETASVEYAIALALTDAGIEFKEISVSVDNYMEGGISINKVIIYSECDKERIINALGSEINGIEVEVINE